LKVTIDVLKLDDCSINLLAENDAEKEELNQVYELLARLKKKLKVFCVDKSGGKTNEIRLVTVE
jgi:hypothetical protein